MLVGVSFGVGRICDSLNISSVLRSGPDYTVSYKVIAGSATIACGTLVPRSAFALVPQLTGNVIFVRDDA